MAIERTEKRILVNVSNHPSKEWTEEQKEEFDVIIDIPFPEIKPEWDTNDKGYARALEEVRKEMATIWNAYTPNARLYTFIAGEWSAAYRLIQWAKWYGFITIVPTTRRMVEMDMLPSGEIVKKSVFKFVRWRIL